METFGKNLVTDLKMHDVKLIFDPSDSLSTDLKSDSDKNNIETNVFIFVHKNKNEIKSENVSNSENYDYDKFYKIALKNSRDNLKSDIKNIFYKLDINDETGQIIADLFDLTDTDLPKVVALKLKFDKNHNEKLIKKFKLKEKLSTIENFINNIDSYEEFLFSESENSTDSHFDFTVNKLVSENFENEISNANCYIVFPYKGTRVDENLKEFFEVFIEKLEKIQNKTNSLKERIKLGIINLSHNEIKRNLDPNNLYIFYKDNFEIFEKELSVKNIIDYLNNEKFNFDCLDKKNSSDEEFVFSAEELLIYNKFNFEDKYLNLDYTHPNIEEIETQIEILNKIYFEKYYKELDPNKIADDSEKNSSQSIIKNETNSQHDELENEIQKKTEF